MDIRYITTFSKKKKTFCIKKCDKFKNIQKRNTSVQNYNFKTIFPSDTFQWSIFSQFVFIFSEVKPAK